MISMYFGIWSLLASRSQLDLLTPRSNDAGPDRHHGTVSFVEILGFVEVLGVVREFDPIQGFGVIDARATPGGCWVHFSHVVAPGYRTLELGETVRFTFEPVAQDGFAYRAVQVYREGVTGAPKPPVGPGGAFSTEFTIYWDDGFPA
jgi:CspA family cold shock protein